MRFDAEETPAGRTDTPTGTETQTDAGTRLEAFKAAFMALADTERAAAAWIADQA